MSDVTGLLSPDQLGPAGGSGRNKNVLAEVQVLGFQLADQDFGIQTDRVVEIIRQVEVTVVPDHPTYIEGIIDVRGRIVPLINLHRMLQLGLTGYDTDNEIIIIDHNESEVGLIVDRVSEIVTVESDQILIQEKESLPQAGLMAGIVDLEDRLIPLLDPKKFVDFNNIDLPAHLLQQADPEAGNNLDEKQQLVLQERAIELRRRNEEDKAEKVKLVTFSLQDEWYALDINKIKEITEMVEVYYIPSAPSHVLGTINLRGVIVSVIDLHSIFGLPTRSTKAASIIIVEHGNCTIGMIVDHVQDIIDLPVNEIEPPLATLDKVKADYLSGEAQWNNHLYGLLKIESIFGTILNDGA